MFRKLSVITAALITASSPAFAQDADTVFSGPFVGVGVGALNNEVEGDDIFDGQDEWSAAFTGFVGYDYQLPHNFVIGLEAGATYSTDDEQVITGTTGDFNFNPQYEINATGRVGYLVRPDLLVYARGGYANLRADIAALNGSIFDSNEGFDGWLAGGGVEYSFYKNLTARAEYRYQELSEGDIDLSRNQAFLGVAYRF